MRFLRLSNQIYALFATPNKIDEKGSVGSPDVVVEILSPDNSTNEMKNKFELYQEARVFEYIIMQPTDSKNLLMRDQAFSV